ncbi:cyclic nucleotide-binding domain-containing protein [Rubrivivax sp. RP6-9]|uniref:cyclic nucleotide-binding domain-containing protein n=1 Tax=Rubrivivax sp. RP6-9 TaxID=3415750 RepID=UPI003CC6B6BF
MKPNFKLPVAQAFLGGVATDLHDSVAKLPTHVRTGDDSLAVLLEAGERIELKTGDWLFRMGDAGRRLFVVQSGSLDVVVQGVDGHEQTLGRFGPGGVFGEVSFLLGGGRSASVRAHERSVIVGIDWVEGDAAANGRLGLALAAVLAQRLRSNNALLLDLLSDDDGSAAPSSQGVVTTSPTLTADRPQVVVRDAIHLSDLRDIIDGRVLAVRVPGWYTSRQCQQLCRKLLRHPGFSRYSIAPDVGVQRVGYSYFETRGDAERLEHYFDQAVPTIAEIRRVCAPLLIPIDRLRLELDEHWPGGAGLASLGGRKMFVGTSRLFEDGHSLPPHQDILARETTDEVATRLLAQMTVNVYLRTPRGGGELEIWDLIPNEAQVAELYTGDYDFLDSTKLPPSAALIKPGVGELVLMLSNRVHAVRASSGGPRVSMSCFVGSTGEPERLVLWN